MPPLRECRPEQALGLPYPYPVFGFNRKINIMQTKEQNEQAKKKHISENTKLELFRYFVKTRTKKELYIKAD